MQLLREWVQPYDPDFSLLDNQENVVYCNKCAKMVRCPDKARIDAYINTRRHLEGEDTFADELCEAFVAANIPLYKVQHPKLKAFLEKYTGKSIPNESNLRRYHLPKVYNQAMTDIQTALVNKYVWVSVDETEDSMGRCVVNVVMGPLEPQVPTKPYLISTAFFSHVNADVTTSMVNASLNKIFPNPQIKQEKVLLFVTDAARYMIKAGQLLKYAYPHMLHITCTALHRICEFVKDEFEM